MALILLTTVLFSTFFSVRSLDNGLALTPPQGWITWQRFRCLTDCVNYPDDCISEQLIQATADRMSEDGYLDAGYEYIVIDDCWLASERDSEGRLQADPERFPNGIQALADYVHSKGLKFGLFEDIGAATCAGYPGIDGQYETDANTFAEWGVDYVKIYSCNVEQEGIEDKFAQFGDFLNQTGRPMLYSCGFPSLKGIDANFTAAVEICNQWRIYGTMDDSWDVVKDIASWFADNQGYITRFAGPGHWNDPDMLIVGDYGLSYDQSIAQMTLWSLLAAPLMMSVDLRTIEPEFRDILLNQEAIAINQDALGIPGLLVWRNDDVYIWTKPILPMVDDNYSYAFGIVSFRNGGGPYHVAITLDDFGLDNSDGYSIKVIFENEGPFIYYPTDPITIQVNPSSAVLLQINPIVSDNKH